TGCSRSSRPTSTGATACTRHRRPRRSSKPASGRTRRSTASSRSLGSFPRSCASKCCPPQFRSLLGGERERRVAGGLLVEAVEELGEGSAGGGALGRPGGPRCGGRRGGFG